MSDPLDPNSFTELETKVNSGFGFDLFSIDILPTADSHIAFKSSSSPQSSGFALLDDIFFNPLPRCLRLQNVVASSLTSSSATLTWSASTTSTLYYEWMVLSQDSAIVLHNALSSGTTGFNSVTIEDLAYYTDYDFYVRAVCSNNETSEWSVVESFRTPCGVFPTDYIEDFNYALDPCWQTASGTSLAPVNFDYDSWEISNYRNFNSNSNAAKLSTRFNRPATWLVSPSIDLGTTRIHELVFDIALTSRSASGLAPLEQNDEVGIMITNDDGLSWNRVQVFNNSNSPSQNGENHVLDLSTYSGEIKIGFYVLIDNTNNIGKDIFIDNFVVRQNLNCSVPTNVRILNVSTTSVDLSWDAVASETTGYEYIVMPRAIPPNITSQAVATGVTTTGIYTANISSFSPNTTYDVYVRTKCDVLGTSDWSQQTRFTTSCPVYTVPFAQNFDTTTVSSTNQNSAPNCWSFVNDSNTQGNYNYVSDVDNFAYSGSNFYVLSSSSASSNSMLITPAISQLNTTGALVSLYVLGSPGQHLGVGTMSDPQDAATYSSLGNFEITSNSYNLFQIEIQPTLDEYIVFENNDDSSPFEPLLIDDISFDLLPDCQKPLETNLDSISASSAQLSWSGSSTATQGYQWLLMTDGQSPDLASALDTGNVVASVENVSLQGFNSSTKYDFYVRSNCGVQGYSSWSDVLSFTTTPINDNACDAIMININGMSQGTDYTNVGATSQDNEPSDNFQSGTEKSVWFKFQAPTTGDVRISTDYFGSTLNDTELAVYNVVDCTNFNSYAQLGFDQDGGVDVSFNSILNLYELIPGQEYYIQVDGSGNGIEGTFGLTVSEIGYIYESSSWYPNDPSGVSAAYERIKIVDGIGVLTSDTSAMEVTVQPEAVLELRGDLTANVLFKSNANGAAQLADTNGNQLMGTTTVERFIPAKRNYRFLSSPLDSYGGIFENWQEGGFDSQGYGTHITGSTTGELGFDPTVSGAPSLYTFNNLQNVWEAVPNTFFKLLNQGEAYRIFVRGDRFIDLASNNPTPSATTLRATGTLPSGTFTPQLATGSDEFSFIGNPYQATVDFSTVLKSNLSNYFYIWDSSVDDRGIYVSVDLNDLTAPLPGSSDASQYIAPGQAVFVRNTSVGNGFIEFNESDKAINAEQVTVFNTFNDFYINSRLYKTTDLNSGLSERDALGLRFRESYTTQGTDEDAIKLLNSTENFAVVNNGLRSIDKQSTPINGHEIQLFFSNTELDNYGISIEMGNVPAGLSVYLIDQYLNSQTEVSNGFIYNFETEDSESNDPRRFKLLFSTTTLSNSDIELLDVVIYPNPAYDTVHIDLSSSDQLVKVDVYNMLGQIVLSTDEVQVDISNLTMGTYLFEVKTNKGIVTQKLIKGHKD